MNAFGEASKPKYFSNVEKLKKPSSLQMLDADTAELLASYLGAAKGGLRIPRTAHETLILLWVIDESGNFWFSLEEMYKADAIQSVFPRLEGVDYPSGYEKLGHPALIEATPARIGGEIIWETDPTGDGQWLISNKSGRYGIRREITQDHLLEVVRLLEGYGIQLVPYYIAFRD